MFQMAMTLVLEAVHAPGRALLSVLLDVMEAWVLLAALSVVLGCAGSRLLLGLRPRPLT